MFKKIFRLIKPTENSSEDTVNNPPESLSGTYEPGQERHIKNTFSFCFTNNDLYTIYLWGTDDDNNPAFATLFSDTYAGPEFSFSSYTVFRGTGGHFPSFDKVRIANCYNNGTRKWQRKLYHKSDTYYGYVSHGRENKDIKDYHLLKKNNVTFSQADRQVSYERMIETLGVTNISFSNFKLKSPEEVLNLPIELSSYLVELTELFSNTSIYKRRLVLKRLIESKPPKSLYNYLIKVGSSEMISGLFMELAKQGDSILAEEASQLNADKLNWLNEGYREGILRCASLYVDSLSEESRAERIKSVYEYPLGKPSVKAHNIIGLKNIVQMSELFGLADIVGKLAYCMDTYKIYFKSNTNTTEYFKRYIRRLIDGYANTDGSKFIETMKSFLTSFTSEDRLFSGDLRFFMRRYLYAREKEGQYVLKPEIWEEHLDDVLEIVIATKSDVIAEPLFYILNSNQQYLNSLPYDKLTAAAATTFVPLLDMIVKIISDKVKKETDFKYELLTLLIDCESPQIQQLALDYFTAAGGKISPDTLLKFMFMQNASNFADLIEASIKKWDVSEYVEFLYSLFDNSRFEGQKLTLSNDLKEILDQSIAKIADIPLEQKATLIQHIIQAMQGDLAENIIELGELIIFSIPINELKEILVSCNLNIISSNKNGLMFKLLRAIKNNTPPDDGSIIDLLENAPPQMLNALVQFLTSQKEVLRNQPGTLLILLESSVFALNELVKAIFEELPADKQVELHKMILDSPDKKTYQFAIDKLKIVYEGNNMPIPAEFITEMLEHPSPEVRNFVSGRVKHVLNSLGDGNASLFVYYVKTLLLLPNKASSGKKNIYALLPKFVKLYNDKQPEIEEILLNMGSSNIISDSENALVALASIKGGDLVEC